MGSQQQHNLFLTHMLQQLWQKLINISRMNFEPSLKNVKMKILM
jgi:hypothetical protein